LEGIAVGLLVGLVIIDGFEVGMDVDKIDGCDVGIAVGRDVGVDEGIKVGLDVGVDEGIVDGRDVGSIVGCCVGEKVGIQEERTILTRKITNGTSIAQVKRTCWTKTGFGRGFYGRRNQRWYFCRNGS